MSTFARVTTLLLTLLTFLSACLAAPVLESSISNLSPSVPSVPSILAAHNRIRAQHAAPPLTWSDELALRATVWANRCVLENTGGVLSPRRYGENIAAATGVFTPDDVVALFIADAGTSFLSRDLIP